jgi:hypothetical protein
MKRTAFLFISAVTAALALSVAAFADATPSPSSLAASSCKTQQAANPALFKTTYATFGKCVTKALVAAHAALTNAATSCKAEQAMTPADFMAAHGGKTFAQFYGSNDSKGKGADANAYGKCVSAKAKASNQQQTQSTINAAKACKTELAAGKAAFTAKYHTFGTCVSQKSTTK